MAHKNTDPAVPARGARNRILYSVAIFALGFGLALLVARFLLVPPAPPPEPEAPPPRTLTAKDIQPFLAAAEAGDFEAMRRVGTELFPIGTIIPNSATLFENYAVASYPPHQVYALLTTMGEEASHRILLTMDEADRVVSFMAEETVITR